MADTATNPTPVDGVVTNIVDGHAESSFVDATETPTATTTGDPAPVAATQAEANDPVTVTAASYDDSDGKGYTPTFNNTVRTIIYVVGLVATAVGFGFIQFGDAGIGAYVSTVAGIITGGFGVAYNPIRMAGK
jgi:hypothetical protein